MKRIGKKIKSLSKRKLFVFGMVFVLVGVLLPTVVYAASSIDEMIPSDKNDQAIYNKYGASHYAFETLLPNRSWWQVGAKAEDTIVRTYDHMLSMLFLGNVQVTRFFNFVAREAFEFKIMDQLIDAAEDILKSLTGVNNGDLGSGFWGSLFGILVSITVLYILFQMLKTQFLDGFQTALSFIMALVVCLGFFAYSGTIIKFMNSFVSEVGATMYSGLAKATKLDPDSSKGVTIISEQVWEELVIRPYSMLQFDDPNVRQNDPQLFNEVLASQPFSDAREAALEKAQKKYPSVARERPDEQMIIILFNWIFSITILGLFCFWALATIYFRIKLLVHAIAMGVTLLASLLPGRDAGFSVLRGQFIKLIGLSIMTAGVMFFLDLSLVLGHLVFEVVYPKSGWFMAMFIEAIVVFVVFRYRHEIGKVFSKAAGYIPMPKQPTALATGLKFAAGRALYNYASNKVSSVFNRKEPEGVPARFNPAALSKADQNLNDATTSSLMLRYQREKSAAEQLAAETGEPVQYSPFVQRVNENLKNGTKNPFRGLDKEWKEEKTRLKGIKDDGGDVRQAILSQGVHEGMNDQEVAATMYSNENAIRQAASFMVNRPKQAIDQMNRAKTLNRNRKLQTAVDDFCMIQLFDRYKVEYKQAIDTAAATGEPVKHSDFVKRMDERFKHAGLNTTGKVNETMLKRSGRLSVAPHFSDMKEFNDHKIRLLKANEAFMKASSPREGIPETPKVNTSAPFSNAFILKNMPALPTSNVLERSIPISLTAKPAVVANFDMKNVKLPEQLKSKIEAAKANLGKSVDVSDLRLEIDTKTNTQVVVDLKQKISPEVSTGLKSELDHLRVMNKANSTVSPANEIVKNQVAQKAQTARKQKQLKKLSPSGGDQP
ncbi:hypothetical protein Theco_4002 (plasmid) [Thermobacillus composti KWC4]|uniref:Uncharacterized protein n=1 Tax=Thermobacillus composti (strain DSM 18247 / JCM 13945 / KWC4) TaxID=717605 RepID=L0EJP6_THECK|nr:hypothetical protein [Thermobacillus composti]AGA60006.1 hypothetical protein Theco_4002 [Thermobacillus composti KWC4]